MRGAELAGNATMRPPLRDQRQDARPVETLGRRHHEFTEYGTTTDAGATQGETTGTECAHQYAVTTAVRSQIATANHTTAGRSRIQRDNRNRSPFTRAAPQPGVPRRPPIR